MIDLYINHCRIQILQWLFLGFVLLSSLPVTAQEEGLGNAVYEDFDQLANTFKKEHQGLYYYTDTITTNKKIDSLRRTLSPSMTTPQFFLKIGALVALSNEGHTNLSLPKKELKQLAKQNQFLPVGIFYCDGAPIIKSVYTADHQELKHQKLIAINGKKVKELSDEMIAYLATDGFNKTSAYEWLSWDFPFYYYLQNGGASSFELLVENIEGVQTTTTVNSTTYSTIEKQSNFREFVLLNDLFKYRAFEIIDSETAILTISAFESKKVAEFYQNAFTEIKEKGIKNLIIDVQRNVGGEEGVENLLAHYLIAKPYQKYASVTIPESFYEKYKNTKEAKEDQWFLKNSIPHRGTFTLQSDYFGSNDFDLPSADLVFSGKVYVLTSGVTFSGGAEFSSMLKLADRATFIGEEVGGAHAGNVSGFSKDITLKNSKIQVSLPVVHFKMNLAEDEDGTHGVQPDYYVPQSWQDLITNRNSKKEFALSLINGEDKNRAR